MDEIMACIIIQQASNRCSSHSLCSRKTRMQVQSDQSGRNREPTLSDASGEGTTIASHCIAPALVELTASACCFLLPFLRIMSTSSLVTVADQSTTTFYRESFTFLLEARHYASP